MSGGASGGGSPVAGILRSPSMVDHPAGLAAVLFTRGCNFRCGYCHNAELRGEGPRLGWAEVERTMRGFRENWVRHAVVTGGEPTVSEGVEELAERLREWGFGVKLDTNGSRPDTLRRMLPGLEYVAMDVKCAPENYAKHTGWGDVARVEESIAVLKAWGGAYELRTTVVESWHGEEEIRAMAEWILRAGDGRKARKLVLQGFVPREGMPDAALANEREARRERLEALAEVAAFCAEAVEVR